MRTLLLLSLIATGCSLDTSSKPECTYNDDCIHSGHCEANVCVRDNEPEVHDELIIVDAPGTFRVDVVANDSDADGDSLRVISPADGLMKVDDRTLELTIGTLGELPASYRYIVTDDYKETLGYVHAIVRPGPVAVRSAGTAAIDLSHFVPGVPLDRFQVLTPPSHGTLAGGIYQPEADACGTDSAIVRVHGDNLDVDIPVSFDIALALVDDEIDVPLHVTSTLDVLANDAIAGLEIESVDSSAASVSADKHALVITNPTTPLWPITFTYTAVDARGCRGTANVSLLPIEPTSVLVGEGLTGDTFDPSLSGDGRYVAFTSTDASVVANDTNGVNDVFVLDTETGVIDRASIASDGSEANGSSTNPAISLDGRYVAFVSKATNLAAADTTSIEDIYVHDRLSGTTSLVSISLDGTGSDLPSLTPHISRHGTRIVFTSNATRLVAGDTNGVADEFVRDTAQSTTVRISRLTSGGEPSFASQPRPRISADGSYVIFVANGALDAPASSVPGTFLADLTTLDVTRVSNTVDVVDIDETGRRLAYGDLFGGQYLYDRELDSTNVIDAGAWPALSANGRCMTVVRVDSRISVRCLGGLLVSAVVNRDDQEVLVSTLRRPAISADGQWIVFATPDWIPGRYVLVRVWNWGYVP